MIRSVRIPLRRGEHVTPAAAAFLPGAVSAATSEGGTFSEVVLWTNVPPRPEVPAGLKWSQGPRPRRVFVGGEGDAIPDPFRLWEHLGPVEEPSTRETLHVFAQVD